MTSPLEQWQDMQEQHLQLLETQQNAYLTAVRTWRTQLAAATQAGQAAAGAGQQGPGTLFNPGFNPTAFNPTAFNPTAFNPAAAGGPSTPGWTVPGVASADEVAEANRTYLHKFNDLQQDFLARLTDLITNQQP